MRKKMLLIYNMFSGKGAIKSKLAEIIYKFNAAGYEVLTHATQCIGDAEEVVKKYASEVDLIVCSGGDGTLDEGVSGVIKSGIDVPLAFLPSGSANDFAGSLGVPKNLLKAADIAITKEPAYFDVGKFNEFNFTYTAAFGLFTDIAYTTNQNLKNVLGYGAYVIEVGKRVFRIPVLKMRVELDDEVLEDGWFFGMITNSKQVGGVKYITGPEVSMDDGVFEMTLVRATRNPIEFTEVLNSIVTGCKCRFVVRRKVSKVKFISEEPIKWTLDGEYKGAHTEVDVESLNNAIRLVVPECAKTVSSDTMLQKAFKSIIDSHVIDEK